MLDHRARYAGECGDLQAIALVGGAVLHGVQKHDAVAVLHRVEVHVGAGGELVWQCGQFKVVRGEQRVGAELSGECVYAGPGECQAVEGAGAAPDLVHQHQACARGVVQDGGGLGHFHHEGRAPAREIVGAADAREDTIDRSDHGVRRRHVAADVREQHDERNLTHVGGFAAHVGAGDDEQTPCFVELDVVRHKRRIERGLHHRMTPVLDDDSRRGAEFRRAPVQVIRARGEVGEHVELGESICTRL